MPVVQVKLSRIFLTGIFLAYQSPSKSETFPPLLHFELRKFPDLSKITETALTAEDEIHKGLLIEQCLNNPDISPEAGLDRAARVAGMTYNQWMCEIVSYAVARSSKKNNIELDTQSVI